MKACIKTIFVFFILLQGAAAFAQDTIKPWQDELWHGLRNTHDTGGGKKQDADNNAAVHHKRIKRIRPAFIYPARQFFFQGETVFDFAEPGVRVTAGYRWGQWGILGAGFGLDEVLIGLNAHGRTDPYGGDYLPVYVYYSGDILKKWVTPFYSVQAGYAYRFGGDDSYITVTPLNHPSYKFYGGFAGAVDFGVKFYPGKRVYVTLAADLDMKQWQDKYANYYYNSANKYISVSYSSTDFLLMPGLKVAVGF